MPINAQPSFEKFSVDIVVLRRVARFSTFDFQLGSPRGGMGREQLTSTTSMRSLISDGAVFGLLGLDGLADCCARGDGGGTVGPEEVPIACLSKEFSLDVAEWPEVDFVVLLSSVSCFLGLTGQELSPTGKLPGWFILASAARTLSSVPSALDM